MTTPSGGGLAPIDRWTLGYAILAAAVIVWRRPDVRLLPVLAAHAVLVALTLLMPHARRAGRAGRVLGDWYPLLIVTALYTEIGVVNTADGRMYDRIVQGWEQALFSFQPAREWIRHQPWPWLSWVLHLGYIAYYPIVVGAPLALWLAGRPQAMQRVLTSIMATFYVCYVFFLLFPVAGPRDAFAAADNAATATAIARWTQQLLDGLAAWGAAFPSSHVAVSVTATVAALREWRGLGYALVTPTALLALGAVYGQFHYAVDVVAGLGVAAVVAVGDRLVRPRLTGAADDAAGMDARPESSHV